MGAVRKLGICTVLGPGCLKEFAVTQGYTESKTVCYVCLRAEKEVRDGRKVRGSGAGGSGAGS